MQAHVTNGDVCIVVSQVFYAQQLLKRFDAEKSYWLLPVDQLAGDRNVSDDVFTMETVSASIIEDSESYKFSTIIWAEPTSASTLALIPMLKRLLMNDGQLYVITSNRLSRALPENQPGGVLESSNNVTAFAAIKQLQQNGFDARNLISFHGIESILWGYGNRFFQAIGRHDLADRSLYRMRKTYAVSGVRAWLAPITVVIGKHNPLVKDSKDA